MSTTHRTLSAIEDEGPALGSVEIPNVYDLGVSNAATTFPEELRKAQQRETYAEQEKDVAHA